MRKVLTKTGIICMVVVIIITFFNISPSIILAEDINMEKLVTELKVRELITILKQTAGETWELKTDDHLILVTGISSHKLYRICNDIESKGYIEVYVGYELRDKHNKINRGDCRDFEVREYLEIDREWASYAKGTIRKIE